MFLFFYFLTIAFAASGCIDVNHINDNPGYYTCECVDPSDSCLSDGECFEEGACPSLDGQVNIDWDTCTYGDWVDTLDDHAVKVGTGYGERLTNDDMEEGLYYVYVNIDGCKSRCDSYSDDYAETCNGLNYVTTNSRCYLYAKAREIESTHLSNRQSTYRPCTNPPQCANWCSYKGINGWCRNCNFDKCRDCTECNEPNLCTIRSTECRPWCHTHHGVDYRCSFEKCEGCNFCPQICPEWCDRDAPKCGLTACQNCEQCREV